MSEASGNIGRKYPLRLVKQRDGDTGATAVRFVHEQESQEQIFYYCSPAATADGRWIPCWSSVSGAWQIHVLDRQEEVSIQLSEIAYDEHGRGRFHSDSPCFLPERNRVYYPDHSRIRWADIQTLETDWLYETPEGYRLHSLSARGRYLVFSFSERAELGKLNNSRFAWNGAALCYRPRSIVAAIDLEAGGGELVWGEMNYLCHAEICPFDDNLVMFCNQSYGARQQEIFVVDRKFTEDKKPRCVISGGCADYRGRVMDYVGHGFFTRDGFIAAQYVEYGGLDRRNAFTDETHYNMVIRPDGTQMRKAHFPGSKKPAHVHCQRAEGLWVGDHWIRADGTAETGWISLMRNKFASQEMEIEALLRTDHYWDRPFHVHPWLNASETEVFLAYNTGRNDNHMAVIEIPARMRGGGF